MDSHDDAYKELRKWGGGPVDGEIDNQIASMPDRPKIVVALIKWGREHDGQNENLFGGLPNYLRTIPLQVFGRPYRVVYLGFDEMDSGLSRTIAKVPQAAWDEGAVYVDGEITILLHVPIREKRLDNYLDSPEAQ